MNESLPGRERPEQPEQQPRPGHGNSRAQSAKNIADKFFRSTISNTVLERGRKIASQIKSSIVDAAQTALHLAQRFFRKEAPADEFAAFDPVEYLQLYYPKINPHIASSVSAIIDQIEDHRTIQLPELEQRINSEHTGEIAFEALENYCIYDFMLRRAIPRILEDMPDDHLRILDVGGGPTIYQHIPLMSIAASIVHAEYLEANRRQVESWKSGAANFDWKSYVEYCQTYVRQEADRFSMATDEVQQHLHTFATQPMEQAENELRARITQIVPVNVFAPNLGMPSPIQPDLVNVSREGSIELMTSNFCIESATADLTLWKQGIRNICGQVPPGKFFLMTAIRNAEKYTVGDKQMPAVPVNGESISTELRNQGFEIVELQELVGSDQATVGYDGMVFVLAKKTFA